MPVDIVTGHIKYKDSNGQYQEIAGFKGEPGDATIDDAAGDGDTTKVWSADKSHKENQSLLSALNDNEEAFGGGEIEPVENKSIQIGGASRVVLPENIEDNTGYCCLCIECKPGDIFVITGRYGNGYNSRRVWGFSNKIGKALSMAADAITATNLSVTAPDDSAYFCYNSSLSEPHKVIKKVSPIIKRISDGFPEKLDIVQGSENVGKGFIVDSDGNVVLDYLKTNSIMNREKTSMIESMSPYYIATTGEIKYDVSGAHYITNYIPIDYNNFYITNGSIYRSATYDENKVFKRINPVGRYFYPNADEKYVVLDALSAEISNIRFFEFKYLDKSLTPPYYADTTLTSNAEGMIQHVLEQYAPNDTLHFVKSHNLYNYSEDKMFFGGTQGVINATGKYEINGVIWSRVINGENVENNGSVATDKYFPVTPGNVLFTNKRIHNSSYYNSNKEFVGNIPQHGAYIGWVVPEGCAYVRLNFWTNPTPADDTISSYDDCKTIQVYTVPGDCVIMPQKPFAVQHLVDGSAVSPNYLDKVLPSMEESEFISSMRGMMIREKNKSNNVYRFGNFNMWIMMSISGWANSRKMFMDYGLDFCGLEEVTITDAGYNVDIAKYMKSWQFSDGYVPDRTASTVCNKGLLSRFQIVSSQEHFFESVPTSQPNNRSVLCCKVLLPRYMDIYEPRKMLSMYVFHGPITTDAIRISMAEELLAIIANDTSDFIVIMGDTNDFGDSLENKMLWQKIMEGGFTPVIPVTTKTITQDNGLVGNNSTPAQAWAVSCIDQFFVSSNIQITGYGVVNTKDQYAVIGGHTSSATDNEYALSDHDFVYADLKFDYDTPRSDLQT